jgi:hypothetical protein
MPRPRYCILPETMRRLTRAEAAKLFPREYELRSLDYGMQYYVAARFAAAQSACQRSAARLPTRRKRTVRPP